MIGTGFIPDGGFADCMGDQTIFVAEFSHETNTFAGMKTTRERFQERREYIGEEMFEELEGTNSTIGGGMAVAEEAGVTLVPSIAAAAMPSGLVDGEAYEFYTERIVSDLREVADDVDGVFLSLHGAMVQEGGDDGEGPLIADVRDIVGEETPIAVTLDLHGNITDEMVDEADALIAYECYPHTDSGLTGERAMRLLIDTIAGEVNPEMAIERPPVLPYGPKQNTREGPMAELMADARAMEDRDDVLKVNVFPGFHQADVPSMGFSIPVVTDASVDAARATARELAETVWNRRESFVGDYPEPAEAVTRARTLVDEGATEDGPVVLADVGDNPGGGGATDGTTVLRQLLDQGIKNAGFAVMHDPDVSEAAADAGVGERVTVDLGGKKDDLHGAPIEDVDLYVKAITDGKFRNTGPMGTGTPANLGRAIRVQAGGEGDSVDGGDVEIILVDNRVQPLDAEIWRHVGIQPERLDVLVVKSTNHFRADYEPMSCEVIPVNSPGLVAMDPGKFDHRNIQRPKFPLDEMDDGDYPDWDSANGGDGT